ncbi:hypothetical protein HAX54_007990 [Datura stramonium]|uniref:Uncharacterized protein n=1 Tax=Datura stramonium TaxID=4076 RepID=A0ABS8TCJ1_DATST|nr:hypothetical protein [Datura stramonium]
MSATLTEMTVEAASCNDLQVTDLGNTQEEPHVEGRIERRGSLSTQKSKLRTTSKLKCGVVQPVNPRNLLLARP